MPKLRLTKYQVHRATWENCERCDLFQCRKRKAILSRGVLPCEVLFVGDYPGLSEEALGQPFIGPVGKVLDRMIAEANHATNLFPRLAFTYALACPPAREDTPTPEQIDTCGERLTDLIRIADPSVVVCVGELAHGAVSPSDTFTIHCMDHPRTLLMMPPLLSQLPYVRNVDVITTAFLDLVPF